MQPITESNTLADLCKRLSSKTYVTVDTEFMREKTYWARLCLIQVASEDEEAAIDAMAPGLDLTPFWALMNDAPPIKVFHAARQDLEIFYKLSGRLPNTMFDTQVAAMVCGFGESIGYQTLVQHFTSQSLDKSARFTDWSRRPLSDRQISYALSDVTLLRPIYKGLLDALEESGRSKWIEEEMAVLAEPETYENPPKDAWKRVKHRSRDIKFLGRLKAVAAWREIEAQNRDLPRNRIVRDETLLEIAAHPPRNAEELASVRGVSEKFSKGPLAKTLFKALDNAEPLPKSELPRKADRRQNANSNAVSEMLKLLLKVRAKETGVAQKLIATNDEVEALAHKTTSDLRFLKGWRAEVFGDDALRLKKGEVALALEDDTITLIPRD